MNKYEYFLLIRFSCLLPSSDRAWSNFDCFTGSTISSETLYFVDCESVD